MISRLKLTFNFWVLLIFVVLEVLLYKGNDGLKTIVSIIEYLFVLFAFFKDTKVGLMYFFSFIVLTLGWGNYFDEVGNQFNFWGLRLAGFSLSIFFTMFFTIILLYLKKIDYSKITSNKFYLFIFIYFCYCLVVGMIRCLQGYNYFDNYTEDVLMFLPAVLYIFLLSILDVEEIKKIVLYSLPLTIIQMLVSMITLNKFYYGTDSFVLQNSIYLIAPFAVFLMKRDYKFSIWITMVVIQVFLIVTGQYFISGKFIILFLFVSVWYLTKTKQRFYFFFVPLFIVFLNLSQILSFFELFFEGSSAVVYKFSQINEAIETFSDPMLLASFPSSMGNIVAECLTVFRHLFENISFLLFGKGFGGGVPDYWGFLSPFTEMAGYRDIDGSRNDFFKMHLPIFDLALKGGILFLMFYIYLLYDFIKRKLNFGIVCFLLLFTIFALSKEMMLFTLLSVTALPLFESDEI